MKKILKSILAASLATTMILSSAPLTYADESVISQDELEELKKILQEEIDTYDLRIYDDYEAERENGLLNGILSLLDVVPLTGNSKAMTVEEEICYDDGGMVFMECGTEMASPNLEFNTEEYSALQEKGFVKVATDPLSTFAADVDTGSYCNLRRMIQNGYLLEDVPSGGIRTEELLNYFDYTIQEENRSDGKFSLQYELSQCPWTPDHELLLMTLQANEVQL